MGIVITPKLLQDALRIRPEVADRWAPFVRAGAELAEVNTPDRVATYLAQIGHESGRLRYTSELWGPTPQQLRYERDPAAPWPASPAQARGAAFAANRLAYTLGNARPGDGSRYRGHGLIQTTGRANHLMTRDGLRAEVGEDVPDFVTAPQMLSVPIWAALSAGLFWKRKGLNAFADTGDLVGQTRRVNGGTNGLADRQLLRTQALVAINNA